jgi:hypothetical protein
VEIIVADADAELRGRGNGDGRRKKAQEWRLPMREALLPGGETMTISL